MEWLYYLLAGVTLAALPSFAAADESARARNISKGFAHPPAEYGPAPFYWWSGEPLTRERLSWQLDQLRAGGVRNTVVSYCHDGQNRTDRGNPPVFSPQWWALFRWVAGECRRRGMQISFEDYTLVNPLLQQIGRETPGMAGGTLAQTNTTVHGPAAVRLEAPAGTRPLHAWAYPLRDGVLQSEGALALDDQLQGNTLTWQAPAGEWQVVLLFAHPSAFDPMHPQSGELACARLYEPFAAHCPEEIGKTIPIFFQDELDFGAHMPFWSARLPEEFRKRKGYDLLPLLPALWLDFGPRTPKIRLDYSDVVTSLLEESYFRPVYEWHRRHGTMLANDNNGRGAIASGRNSYGDYFRTMRWYGAPGNDDPNITGPRAFRGLKVNSSIAHLYQRERVWCEAFHSSGWGTSPAQIVAGMNEDYVYGATLFNLHGLYYTTFGGWWEWAPPDFHFRQPYWQHFGSFSTYVSRLSYLLSQGEHCADVAMVYPIAALEAGMGGDAAEQQAFALGNHLFRHGLDFDFVDDQSFARATLEGGTMQASGEKYRAMIFPNMAAVRFATLQKALQFFQSGGVVLAYGCLPEASDRAGRADPEVDALTRALFGLTAAEAAAGKTPTLQRSAAGGQALYVPNEYDAARAFLDSAIARDFIPEREGFAALHRRSGALDIYFVCNIGKEAARQECRFRAHGVAEEWDAWTGRVTPLPEAVSDATGARLPLTLAPGEARLIVFRPGEPGAVVQRHNLDRLTALRNDAHGVTLEGLSRTGGRKEALVQRGGHAITLAGEAAAPPSPLALDGPWEFELLPLLDNRWGDFRLPASHTILGAEARRFRYAPEGKDSSRYADPDLDDSAWENVTCSYGQHFWKLGPLPPNTDTTALEARLRTLRQVDPETPLTINGREYRWQSYVYSERLGIEQDPWLQHYLAGPHGLKERVPDEFLDLTTDQDGAVWFLWTAVRAPRAQAAQLFAGSSGPCALWLNGEPALSQKNAAPATNSVFGYDTYELPPLQASITLREGANPLLLRLTQPGKRRLRAYAAARAGEPPLPAIPALRWFAGSGVFPFDPRPEGAQAGWYRFQAPPGLRALRFTTYGEAQLWVAGKEITATVEETRADGARVYRAGISHPAPDPVTVALRLAAVPGQYGGAALPEPVMLECGPGRAALGDWTRLGLETYSGAAWYRRTVTLNAAQAAAQTLLDLGAVAATAKVRVNGKDAGTLIAPPWQLDISPHLHPGENRIEIQVANTLANHYSVGIPTRYVFPGQTLSGLLGPVRLVFQTRVKLITKDE